MESINLENGAIGEEAKKGVRVEKNGNYGIHIK